MGRTSLVTKDDSASSRIAQVGEDRVSVVTGGDDACRRRFEVVFGAVGKRRRRGVDEDKRADRRGVSGEVLARSKERF